jgi:hypothetical protein
LLRLHEHGVSAALLLPKPPGVTLEASCFPMFCRAFFGALGRTRTCDLLINSQKKCVYDCIWLFKEASYNILRPRGIASKCPVGGRG